MSQFDWPATISVLYMTIGVITSLWTLMKFKNINIIWATLFTLLWPIFWVTIGLIYILEINDNDRRSHRKIKGNNHFDTDKTIKDFIKNHYSKDTINNARKGRIGKVEKANVKSKELIIVESRKTIR